MKTQPLTAADEQLLATFQRWLDSMADWLALLAVDPDEPLPVNPAAPLWLHNCVRLLDRTLFAPVHTALPAGGITPYRLGYAFGLIQWGSERLTVRPPVELRLVLKKLRLSKPARRQLIRQWQDFLIRAQLLTRKNGRLQPAYLRELNFATRLAAKYKGADQSAHLRGLAAGLEGVGPNVPGDRSTDATDVYLALLMWWRLLEHHCQSITQLHAWLTRALGANRAGHLKRTEKICQRLGLKLKGRGRPRKIQTPRPLALG